MSIRKPILAGSWYPDTGSECEKEIRKFLEDERVKKITNEKIRGGIAPHAGWFFSGNIACNVIHALGREKEPDVIVIFGMHLHKDSPCSIMADGEWETPFGNLKIEKDLAGELMQRFAFETGEMFYQDNTIELQVPFIKYFFQNVKIVTIGVPPVKESLEIGKTLAEISAGISVKVIGSTDLTHYGMNYDFMPEGVGRKAVDWVRNVNDQQIIDVMLALDPDELLSLASENKNACCSGAAATAISAAKHLGAEHAELLAYSNSYDKSPGDSFVGYAGIVF
jgi:MEMO1 family protein